VKHFYKKNKTRDELIRKDRLVKFLCQRYFNEFFSSNLILGFSSVDLPESQSSTNEITAAALLQQIKDIVNANNDVEEETNRTNLKSSPFQRTVNWTFENMKMLIGSDLPIFGDEKHPAVSLRLRYIEKNILHQMRTTCFLIEI